MPTSPVRISHTPTSQNANLRNAKLTGALLNGTNFHSAVLTGSNIGGDDLSRAHLYGVASGSINEAPATLPAGWRFVAGHLLGGHGFVKTGYLVGPGAVLIGAVFFAVNLSNADLSNANLTNAYFTAANLTNVRFAGATLTGVESGSIVGSPRSLPVNWLLEDGHLIGPGAHLRNANLKSANLAHADLIGANFAFAFLNNADLTNADLNKANLTDADLAGAAVTGATVIGAIWSNTIC